MARCVDDGSSEPAAQPPPLRSENHLGLVREGVREQRRVHAHRKQASTLDGHAQGRDPQAAQRFVEGERVR